MNSDINAVNICSAASTAARSLEKTSPDLSKDLWKIADYWAKITVSNL